MIGRLPRGLRGRGRSFILVAVPLDLEPFPLRGWSFRFGRSGLLCRLAEGLYPGAWKRGRLFSRFGDRLPCLRRRGGGYDVHEAQGLQGEEDFSRLGGLEAGPLKELSHCRAFPAG